MAVVFASGCLSKWPHREGFIRSDGVYVFHAPGISGPIPYDFAFARGLIEGGVEEVRPIDWQSWSAVRNLSDHELHDAAAKRLVETLRGFHSTSPHARIVLTAHSGGAVVVTRAVEMLQPDEGFVEQVWLIAASMSPEYDFSAALVNTDRIVAISSLHDWLILGAGTRTFGTSDGDRTDSGGRVGFTTSALRFEHWPYDPSWLTLGNTGDHLTMLSRRFARSGIAPAILRFAPDGRGPEIGRTQEESRTTVPRTNAYNNQP